MQDLVLRVCFILGNLMAKLENARSHLFAQSSTVETLLSVFSFYSAKDIKVCLSVFSFYSAKDIKVCLSVFSFYSAKDIKVCLSVFSFYSTKDIKVCINSRQLNKTVFAKIVVFISHVTTSDIENGNKKSFITEKF